MEVSRYVVQMKRSAAAIRALCDDPGLEPHWKPSHDRWSTVEILCHLADEEREDFRLRLDLTLHHPEQEWPPIDPAGWVTQRDYAAKDPQEALDDFLAERTRSIDWLGSLLSPDWSLFRTHPKAGKLSAGDLFAAWVTHDLLHLRQILRLQHEWNETTSKPYRTLYAGEW